MGRFKKYSIIPRLFKIIDEDLVKKMENQMIEKSYVESFKELLKRLKIPCVSIRNSSSDLHSKEVKNVNPTKACHSGMNLEHLQLKKI